MKTFDFPVLFKEASSRWGNEDNRWMRENEMAEHLYDPDNIVTGATAIFKVADQAWIISRAHRLFSRNVARTLSKDVRLLSVVGDGILGPDYTDREILEFCVSQVAMMPTIDSLTLGRDLIANVPDSHFILAIGKVQNSGWSGAHGANTPPKIAERLEREAKNPADDYPLVERKQPVGLPTPETVRICAHDPANGHINLYSIPRRAGKTTAAKNLLATETEAKGDLDGDTLNSCGPSFTYHTFDFPARNTLGQFIDSLHNRPLDLPKGLVEEINKLISNLNLYKDLTEGKYSDRSLAPEPDEADRDFFNIWTTVQSCWFNYITDPVNSDAQDTEVAVTNPGQVGGPPWDKLSEMGSDLSLLGLSERFLEPVNAQPLGRRLIYPLQELTMKKEYSFPSFIRKNMGKRRLEGTLKVSGYQGNEHGLATFIDEPLDANGKTDDPLKAVIMAETSRNEAEKYLKDREDK